VLEPAAFGKPVIWGINDEKYIEAIGLRNASGGFTVKNATEFTALLQSLITNEQQYIESCNHAAQFIKEHSGATKKTIHFIKEHQLLT
jgi:3-deoxy-D-manno-octulosonic-acid transferase